MPRLSELTDYDPMGNATGIVPIAEPAAMPSPLSNNVDKIINSLFRPDEKRLQLWPEKLIRSGTTAAGDIASGKVPTMAIDPVTGDVHTSPEMIEKAQEMSALAGTGGLGGAGGTLNATPSLRPALKYKDKLYKGKPGQEHMDVIPESLYPDFQKKAMSGDDIKEYNFGFINDKGHFLSREDALKYGIDNGLIDPQAGKYGALTSTLFADSSKPGTAIEALAKTEAKLPKDYFDKVPMDRLMSKSGTEPSHPGYRWEVYDTKTGKIARDDIMSRAGATKTRDNLDNKYGAGGRYKERLVKAETMTEKEVQFLKDNGIDITTNTPALPPGYELKPVPYNPFELKS